MNLVKITFFVILLVLKMSSIPAMSSSMKDVNFLIVLLDDASMSDFSILGSPTYTPNVDRFINSSLYFPNAISGSAVCSPSRVSIQTGRSPLREGVLKAGNQMRTTAFTIADLVKSQGYETMYFGKWHLGVEQGLKAFGYDIAATFTGDAGDEARLYNAYIETGFKVLDQNGKIMNKERFRNKFTDSVFIDFLIENLERINRKNETKNWLAMLGMITTHTFKNQFFVSPTSFQKCVSGQVCQNAHKKTRAELMYETTVYDFDQAFGKLLTNLKRLGCYDNTMIFFTSDNGLEDRDLRNVVERYPWLTRPKRNAAIGTLAGVFKGDNKDYYNGIKTNYIGAKRSLYSGGHRIGMAIRYPPLTSKKEGVNMGNIFHGDILPTIADMLSIELSQFSKDIIDGVSILPVMKEKTHIERQKAIIIGCLASPFSGLRCGTDYASIILGNYSLIMSRSGARKKLFNTYADPGQTNNIQEANKDIVSIMQNEYSEFLSSLEVSFLFESYKSDCRDSKDVQTRRPTYIPQGFQMLDIKDFIDGQHYLPPNNQAVKNVLNCFLQCEEDSVNCSGFAYDFRKGYRRFRCFLYKSSDIRTYTSTVHRRSQRTLVFYSREQRITLESRTPTVTPTSLLTPSPTPSPTFTRRKKTFNVFKSNLYPSYNLITV